MKIFYNYFKAGPKSFLRAHLGLFLAIFLLFAPQNSQALSPEERLLDTAQEQRAMRLFTEVKCLVCNGQSVESSSTEFSYEMRKIIRQKIAAGESDDEVLAELAKEFGDDVLLSSQKNIGLWLTTFSFSALLAVILIRNFRRRII